MTSPKLKVIALAGPLLVLAYGLINSAKSVLEGALVQRISPEFLALNTFFLAQAFYLLACRDRRRLRAVVQRCLPDVLGYNVSTTISWLAVLYSFTVLEPVVANSIITGLIPSLTILVGRKMRPGTKPLRLEVVAAVGVLTAMVYLAWESWRGTSGTGGLTLGGLLFGLAACALTAAAVAGNTFYTKRLGEAGMTVGEMMTCRFVLLILTTLVIVGIRGSAAPYSGQNILAILLISLVGVIISLYLLQMGIVRTEPITVSMLFGANLVITFAIQFFDPRLPQSAHTFLGVLSLAGFMAIGAWARYRSPSVPPPDVAPVVTRPVRANDSRTS
jgi:drug/metabolite transporter (DMT)-like permease